MPGKQADRRTLIRRLSFDLIGLPPTPEQVDAFLADNSPEAYEKLVDRLLASPHFGERMALYWLDLVRYADTGRLSQRQSPRRLPLPRLGHRRLQSQMPFDQFTTEQLAGDLLPKATLEQKIASGYNRLLQTTEEGGAQAKEYQAKYYADRVRNLSTVWLGMTLGCCECHDHKFDPFATKEFYSMQAFFADIQEVSVGRQAQTPIAQIDKLKKLDDELTALRQELAKLQAEADRSQVKWEDEVRLKKAAAPKEILAIVNIDPAKRNAKQKEAVAHHYPHRPPCHRTGAKELDAAQKQRDAVVKSVPTTLITTSGPPRTIRVLPRGNWLDETGEIVQPATPAVAAAARRRPAGAPTGWTWPAG